MQHAKFAFFAAALIFGLSGAAHAAVVKLDGTGTTRNFNGTWTGDQYAAGGITGTTPGASPASYALSMNNNAGIIQGLSSVGLSFTANSSESTVYFGGTLTTTGLVGGNPVWQTGGGQISVGFSGPNYGGLDTWNVLTTQPDEIHNIWGATTGTTWSIGVQDHFGGAYTTSTQGVGDGSFDFVFAVTGSANYCQTFSLWLGANADAPTQGAADVTWSRGGAWDGPYYNAGDLASVGIGASISDGVVLTTANMFVSDTWNPVRVPSGITIDVASGTSQTQTQAGYPLLSGSVSVVKIGGGTLVVDQANTLTASTTIQQGTLRLANATALASSKIVPLAGGTVSLAPYLQTTVGGLAPNAGGLVNLGNGLVTVASGLSATDLVTAIKAGRGDGSWTGASGITSSVAASDLASGIPRAVGWLDNGDGSVTAAFAAPGDTNLDWQVDVLDASNFLSFGKYDTGLPATWLEGDFNYDGVVDVLDASDFFGTGLYDTGNYNTPVGASDIAAVPEPSATALAALTVAGWAAIGYRKLIRRACPHDR